MKKTFAILNALLIVAICFGNYAFITEGGIKIKAVTSGLFALMGIVNLCYALLTKEKQLKFPIFMSIGLIFAMLGDIVLGYNFIIGAALFALGHVFYFICASVLMKIRKFDLIFIGILFLCAGSFVLFCPLLSFDAPVMKYVCFIYALIISFMTGKNIANCVKNPCPLMFIMAIGSVLFFFSDLMLVLDWFMDLSTGTLCMATYYPAQFLLASSVFVKETIGERKLKR